MNIQSIGRFNIKGRCDCISIKSPIECDRSYRAFKEEIGEFTVDGERVELIGIMFHVPSYPIRVGEIIDLCVKENK